MPLAAPRLAAPHSTNRPRIHLVQPVGPAIGQSSHDSAASERSLDTRPRTPHGEGKGTDTDDPSRMSPTPEKIEIDEGGRLENKLIEHSETSTVPAPEIDGPDETDPIKHKQSASSGESKAIVDPITRLRPPSVVPDPPLVGELSTV